MLRRLLLACLAALFLVLLPLRAQTPTYSDVTEVNAVEIPVQVLLDGKPVRGLKAENFAVYQEKQKQIVTGFEVVDLLSLPAEKALEVPAPARRHFLLLFDLAFSEPKAIVRAREAAKALLPELHPSDVVAVATYAASRGSELVVGFTPDRGQVEAAIDTLGLPELVDRNTTDPLRLLVESIKQDFAERSGSGRGGNVGSEVFLKLMEKFLAISEAATNETRVDRITALTRSFTDLARLMRGVSGKKYVVYLSEGYDSSLLLGVNDEKLEQDLRESSDRGQIWKVDSNRRFGSSDALNDIESMMEEFRRADCTIQSVDIGGLRASGERRGGMRPSDGDRGTLGYERTGGKESLFQLARDTGGDLYENFNDLSAAMGKMLESTGVTYVLTIQPDTPLDGAYHPLKVELRGVPKGARVVHRPGYFAPKPFAQRTSLEKLMLTAGQVLMGEEGGQVRTSVLATPMPPVQTAAGDGTADVPIVIAIDGPSLLHLHQGNDLPTEIYVYALDEKGQVRDFLAQTLALDLFKVEGKLLQAGLKFYGHLELPPGSYKARVLVRNGRTGFHGLRIVALEVPALGGTSPVLLPPLFPEPKGEWLVTREAARPGRRDVPVPFRLGDQPFLPAALPALEEGRETRFAMLGYNLGTGELQLRSQVLTADGHEVKAEVKAADLALVGRQPGSEGSADRLELSFRPPNLQPGEYLLRVTVIDGTGKTGTTTAPFVVAGATPGERS